MMVLFDISCIVFSTKCYILCMYTLKIIFQFSMVAYSIFVKLCHPSNGFVNIKLAYIIAINGWILTSTIFWLDIDQAVHFCQAIHTTNVISYFKNTFWYFYSYLCPVHSNRFPYAQYFPVDLMDLLFNQEKNSTTAP